MLMSVKCSAVTSVRVTLTYDDNFVKNEVISMGDIISVEFNKNGLRRKVEGKVVFINASGSDPKNWYIIIDRSEDFDSDQVRFCPVNILDLHIIRSGASIKAVKTTNDRNACPYIRIVKNRLQYSIDGVHWKAVLVDPSDIEIRDENGTDLEENEHERPHHRPIHKPSKPHHHNHQYHNGCGCSNSINDDDNIDPDYTIDSDEEFADDNEDTADNSGSGLGNVDHTLPDIIIDNSL